MAAGGPLTLVTVSAAFALVTLWWRGRVEADTHLQWFAVGLAVAVPAMVLQLVSFPMVATSDGPFGTTGEGSSTLYLISTSPSRSPRSGHASPGARAVRCMGGSSSTSP